LHPRDALPDRTITTLDKSDPPAQHGHSRSTTRRRVQTAVDPGLVEEDWMEVRFSGLPEREPWASVDWDADPNWEFRTATDFGPEQLHSRYREACRRSRHIVAQAEGLDQLSIKALRDGRHFSLRWVLLHLIEETARHAGHADFLREAIDGTVGE